MLTDDTMSDPVWKCPQCNSNHVVFMVELIVQAPMEYYHNLSKANLRKKEVKILGAYWSFHTLTCLDCGWFKSGVEEALEKANWIKELMRKEMKEVNDLIKNWRNVEESADDDG